MTLAKATTSFAMAERAKIRKDWLPKAIKTIAECMTSANEQIRLAAAVKIVEYSIGKAPSAEDIDGIGKNPSEDFVAMWRALAKSGAVKIDPVRVYEVVRIKDEPLVLDGTDDSQRGEDREN